LIPEGRFSPLFGLDVGQQAFPVGAFRIDVRPVTRARFGAFLSANPQWAKARVSKALADEMASAFAEFEGVAKGDPSLKAGGKVKLEDLGEPFDGKYTITGLSAGSYNVQFSILGYQSKLFTGIRVTANAPTTLDVTLQEEDLEAAGETVVIGDRPLVDVESGTSTGSMNREQIEAAPVRTVQGVVAQQAGVTADPTGLYIRGGRANETGFIVDGVSAKDPLAGTGFGLDLGSNAFSEVEVTTGGVGADVGDAGVGPGHAGSPRPLASTIRCTSEVPSPISRIFASR